MGVQGSTVERGTMGGRIDIRREEGRGREKKEEERKGEQKQRSRDR